MRLYNYIALDKEGLEQKGDLEAPDSRSAAVMLRRQGFFVVELKGQNRTEDPSGMSGEDINPEAQEAGDAGDIMGLVSRVLGGLRPVRDRDRILFLQQAALMLRSGLTLLQCLEETTRTTSKPKFAAALGRMSMGIRSGMSFSQAITKEGRLFPPIVVKLIESAEASGEMDTILDQLALHLDQKAQVRTNLLTSLIYPTIVVLVTIGVTAFLILKVIPRFARFFASRNTALPWSTQLLLDISGFVTGYGLFLLVGLASGLASLGLFYATDRGRQLLDRGFLMIPVMGKLLKAGAMAHIGLILSILLRSGVTLLESLQITRGIVNNRAIATCMESAANQILGGRDLAGGLRHPAIPPLVPQLVEVGERTGTLVRVLEELGHYYDRQLQMMTKRMSLLIEPVLILIIGGIVGFVYFAFFQALFQLATAGR